jgi:hypothetical protein
MSTLSSRKQATPIARFESAKTTTAISARNRGVLDTLIIASLDREVQVIAPAAPITIMLEGLAVPHLPDCCLQSEERSIVVDVYRQTRAAATRRRFEAVAAAYADQGTPYECREPPTVFGSPLLMNCRAVWGCRRIQVSAADQVRLLDLVGSDPLPLAQVAQAVRADDGVPAVLALACHAILQLDLETIPLGPETRVWRRGHLPCAPASMSEGGN